MAKTTTEIARSKTRPKLADDVLLQTTCDKILSAWILQQATSCVQNRGLPLMPEVEIALTVLAALVLGIRASWVWLLRGRSLVSSWRGTMGSVAISLVLLDCLVFVRLFCIGEIGGFGTHYMTTRMVGWYFLASVVTTSGAGLVRGESRWETLIAGLLTTALWFGSGFVA